MARDPARQSWATGTLAPEQVNNMRQQQHRQRGGHDELSRRAGGDSSSSRRATGSCVGCPKQACSCNLRLMRCCPISLQEYVDCRSQSSCSQTSCIHRLRRYRHTIHDCRRTTYRPSRQNSYTSRIRCPRLRPTALAIIRAWRRRAVRVTRSTSKE